MGRVRQIILFVLGIAIMIALLVVFFYAFIFLAVIGLIYYIYRKIFKKKKTVSEVKDNKRIEPVIIDMEEQFTLLKNL